MILTHTSRVDINRDVAGEEHGYGDVRFFRLGVGMSESMKIVATKNQADQTSRPYYNG